MGHSHIPLVFKQEEDSCTLSRLLPGVGLIVSKSRLIINPGGVGQPRDGNPEASYAIYDSEVGIIRLHRVPYDIEKTQEKMVHAGLPLRLAIRLKSGV